jgi:hypothetical protein
LRMRMANEGGFNWGGIFRFFEQRFQTSGGAGDKERFNFTHLLNLTSLLESAHTPRGIRSKTSGRHRPSGSPALDGSPRHARTRMARPLSSAARDEAGWLEKSRIACLPAAASQRTVHHTVARIAQTFVIENSPAGVASFHEGFFHRARFAFGNFALQLGQ